jgi:hypothetical protein
MQYIGNIYGIFRPDVCRNILRSQLATYSGIETSPHNGLEFLVVRKEN